MTLNSIYILYIYGYYGVVFGILIDRYTIKYIENTKNRNITIIISKFNQYFEENSNRNILLISRYNLEK